jgi:uncharacterized protein YfaS (alpha-2-macroglobulin family)
MDIDKVFESMKQHTSMFALAEAIKRQNRIKGQEKAKARKSYKMKLYWQNKKQKEREKQEDEDYFNSLPKEEKYRSCTCWQGNPPCTYCTDTNYCEDCDIKTWEDECPNCGKLLTEEGWTKWK